MRSLCAAALIGALAAASPRAQDAAPGAVPVEVRGSAAAGWTLLRAGAPYYVRGAGGDKRGGPALDVLASYGGNSIRTWGSQEWDGALAQARAHGMTVLAGFWLPHKGAIDYANPDDVRALRDRVLAAVRAHKDDPAVLAWALGNEMEVDNDTAQVWTAVEAIAVAVKAADPDHPVLSVVAEVSPDKIARIRRYAPDLDLLGVNSYGGLPTLGRRLAAAGWDKPYLVTEYGPEGPRSARTTPWGAPLEPTSTEKAAFYRQGYLASIQGQPGLCLGSYAFLWGHQYQMTTTWKGLLMPETLETLGAIDTVSELWTGRRPRNVAPDVERLEFAAAGAAVRPGQALSACAAVADADGDQVALTWRLAQDVEDGGETLLRGAADRPCVSFAAPSTPGAYRLYLEARDGNGHGATANAPFLVD